MKITVVITYYERQQQLTRTLASLDRPDSNFEVVIVDDASEKDIEIGMYNFPVHIIKLKDKTWTNCSVAWNTGFKFALQSHPDVIIMQSAECSHAGNILEYTESYLTDKNYISFGCYSLAEHDLLPPQIMNQRAAHVDGDSAWYNHPIYRPAAYHFCTAITADNLRKLNGIDERFAYGIGYEDNMFVKQVQNLGLKIEITSHPFVFHQYHYNGTSHDPALIKKNADLWAALSHTKEYKAKHLITPDL